MCLAVIGKKKIAEEDIVCYKALNIKVHLHSEKLKDGDKFSGTIASIKTNGRITIEEGYVYFCTNNPSLDGDKCEKRGRYKYSWVFDSNVTELKVKGLDNLLTFSYITPYMNFKVEIGNEYTSELINSEERIYEGLHSFENLANAKQVGNRVAECIIPKGSTYYTGEFQGNYGYASDKIKYVKLCV